MITCGVEGCPCFYSVRPSWHNGPNLRQDDTELETVLARRTEPGIGRSLSHHDKYRAWLVLEASGYSAAQTARTLAVAPRTVCRWRAAARTLENA